MKCAGAVGRLIDMAADYLPDHHVMPEDLAFQVLMLSTAALGVARAAYPLLVVANSCQAAEPVMSLRDGKAYSMLFKPTGLSLSQYKVMKAVCMDWVVAEPGQEILCEDLAENEEEEDKVYTYWLYNGSVSVLNNGKLVANMNQSSKADAATRKWAAKNLFSESNLLQRLECHGEDECLIPETTMQAGDKGATLLRINVSKLDRLLATDEDLEQPLRTLAVQALQAKLALQFQ